MKIIAIGDFHCKFPKKLKQKIKFEKPDLILSTGDYASEKSWRPLFKKIFKARTGGINLTIEDILGKDRYRKLLKKDYISGKVPIKDLEKLNIPVLSVFGNGDWSKEEFKNSERDYEYILSKSKNIKNIQKKKVNFDKLKIIGFGGYLDPDFYFTDEGIKILCAERENIKHRKRRYLRERKRFFDLMKNNPDIVLSHYTPYKILDKLKDFESPFNGKNMGVSFYNKGIEKFSPKLFVCGHMHENQGIRKFKNTIIINPGSASDGKMAIIEFDELNKKFLSASFIK